MDRSIDPAMAKELELFIDRVLKEHWAERERQYKAKEAAVREQFKDLYEGLPEALKSTNLPLNTEEIQAAIISAIRSWGTGGDEKYRVIEEYGLALREALSSLGFDERDFHEKLVRALDSPPDRYFSTGLGAVTCWPYVERYHQVKTQHEKLQGGDDVV